ncbi:MAG: transcriptional regulator [Candidatus Parabeggiatoa sp. nov. 3]|nr:MAG: transcriptional regulator [Gammaproteobacteria bacterium]RKZ52086.1 MAG: transcriptional regulator [Gammaproteobacteria bacterium]RKZ73716.1 MAG: transcriptional regulator [Gammaproteobacteria bacterium]
MTHLLENTINYWPLVAQVFSVPQTKADYQRSVSLLDELLDLVGDDESHQLISLIDTLSLLVESYENEHYPIDDVSAKEVLQSIMQEQGLQENDLPEIGDQDQVLSILKGEKELNSQQIRALSTRFQVSQRVFS